MKKILRIKYKRFMLAFVLILLVFISVVISVIISQHNEILNQIESDAQREIELIGNFTREALLTSDYAAVEQFLNQWAEEHEEILTLKATAPNDFILVNFERLSHAEASLTLTHRVRYSERDLVLLEMTKDLTPAQEYMAMLSIPLVAGAIVLTIIIGALLWYAMRKLALLPMERELAIRAQGERKFRLLLESAPDAMIFVDKGGNILMVNAQTELLFGYNRSTLEGQNIEMLMPERYRQNHRTFRDKFSQVPAARPMGLEMELYGLTRKGKEFPADISLSPIETEEGLFILAAVRDMTERKLAEEKIRRSYHFQAAISSILSNSLKPVDLDKQLDHILNTILSIPGLSLESMGCIYLTENNSKVLTMKAQHGLSEAIKSHCSKIPFSRCLCGQAASSRKIIFAECTDSRHTHHADYGDDFPHSHYCVPIVSGDHTLGVINLVVQKGHQKSKDEEEMLTSVANTLAGIIEHNRTDRERQKLQEQLAQVEKLSALGRFTANVAHEIRTPLTLIGGFARRLGRHIPEETKDREYSDIIVKEVVRLEKILKNVLTYSREASLNLELLNLNEIIIQALRPYEEKCVSQSIEVHHAPGDIPPVMVDNDQVIEVMNNILSNAIDAMQEGGTLTIATDKTMVHGKEYAVVNVSDTGEGITDEQINMIFEPFFSTKIIGQGTGLGLPISKKIMEDHGGFITVDTALRKGSRFTLYFPLQTNHKLLESRS
jgi:PAS domain S-box-containing protein